MKDYSAVEGVLVVAIPQVYAKKYPDGTFSRTIHVSDDADDNFVVTPKQVLISPKCVNGDLNLMQFCSRIARACWDFDHLAERNQIELREEFQSKLERTYAEIIKRWGWDGLQQMMDEAYVNLIPEDSNGQ